MYRDHFSPKSFKSAFVGSFCKLIGKFGIKLPLENGLECIVHHDDMYTPSTPEHEECDDVSGEL